MTFNPRPDLDPVKDYDELVAHIAEQTGLTEEVVRQWLGPLTGDLEAGATPEEIRSNVEKVLAQRPNRRARRAAQRRRS